MAEVGGCVLLSTHGHALISDAGSVRGLPWDRADPDQLVIFHPDTEILSIASQEGRYVLDYGRGYCRLVPPNTDDSPGRVVMRGESVVFSCYGVCATINPEGDMSETHLAEAWETFFLLPMEAYVFFRTAVRNGLYSQSLQRLVEPSEITVEGHCISFCGYSVDTRKNAEASLSDSPAYLSVSESCVDAVTVYNPGFYYCAFGRRSLFRMALMSIMSIVDRSDIEAKFIIFTDTDEPSIPQEFVSISPFITVVIVRSPGIISKYYSRYRLSSHKALREYHPLVYIDTDILCNASIKPLIEQCMTSDVVLCNPEASSFDEKGRWFIGDLLTKDVHLDREQVRTINSGIFAGRSWDILQPMARFVDKFSRHALEHSDIRPEILDQVPFNYFWAKFGGCDLEAMRAAVVNFISDEFDNIPKTGFLHFCNIYTDHGSKEDMMVDYVKHLEAPIHKT